MIKNIATVFCAICLLLSANGMGFACDFCLLSQGISPLDTMKGSGIKISERYSLLDQIYQGTGKTANTDGTKEEHWTAEMTGFYGITPEFTLLGVVPYRSGRTNDPMGAGSASGLGDVALMGRYTFFKREQPESTNVFAGIAGIKFATGKTDARTADGTDFLDSHLQPGTGSTDFLLGVSFSHSLDRFSVAANLLGTVPGKGKFGDTSHRFGNALNYDLSAKYRVAPEAFSPQKPQYFLALGINGEDRQREKIDDVAVDDSGGNVVYLTPGAQVVFAPHWVVELSYQHAVYHNLNGTQLGETYKAITGVTYLF